ncbi:hypothetical protein SFRURICE_012290 [Spodoptera frugiperda]|nr:hypothetical protein SFRURICE_012290 [Spodoptera frugiperda]
MRARCVAQNVVACLVNDGVHIILLKWMSTVDSWCVMLMMKGALLLTVVYLLRCEGAVVVAADDHPVVNDRPIIGVLSQEQSMYLHTKYPEENYTSYIAASYVKDVEASGARVVPILIGKDRSYYEELMGKLNGVLFPGGATYFNQSDGYADAGQHIYEIAQEMNDAGDYFPIFGTCLGFELLIILASGRGEPENRIRCYSYSNIPLNFTDDYRTSKMFKETPEDILELLKNEDNLISHNLTRDWRVTSHSYDDYGVKFIATVEHTRYPFYGVQFHPEKSSFEWKLSKNYPHSINAVKSNRYFMDFFVKECRKNMHSFKNQAEENAYVIYNYEPHFTGVLGSAYHQCYLFEPRGTVANNV